MIKESHISQSVRIIEPVNIYGCSIGDNTCIGPFVEIQNNVNIGKNCKISSHSFICSSVTLSDNVFIGHGVMFTNDKFSDSPDIKKWKSHPTHIGKNVRIGSNTTLLPVRIGDNSIIGAGSVVTKDIPSNVVVCGNPAKIIRKIS